LIEEKEKIDAIANEISKQINSEDLYVAGLPLLSEIIWKLWDLNGKISALRDKVNDLRKQLRILKAKLSGLDSEKKLNDLLLAI